MGITYRQGHNGRLSVQEMDNNFHFIEDSLNGLTNSIASLSSLEVGLSASLTALAALEHLDVAGLTASVQTLTTNLAGATTSVQTLTTNLASATASIKTLTDNLATTNGNVSSLNVQVASHNFSISLLGSGLAAATASIKTLATNLAVATASILGLSMSIDNISLTPGPTGATGAQGVQGNQGQQGIEGPVGVSGLTWQGAWSNNSLYNKNSAVGYASASWWCVATVSSTASVIAPDLDTTHINWTLLAAQGSQGPAGAQGVQGPTGPQGVQGSTGQQGIQGPTGAQGIQGPTGTPGVQGNQGQQGIEGPVGVSGLTWQGAWSNNSLYDKNSAVGWASASWWCVATVSSTASVIAPDLDTTHINWTLLAAQGSQGPAGSQGVQGPTGPQGVKGPTGPSGTQSLQQTIAYGNTITSGAYSTIISASQIQLLQGNNQTSLNSSGITLANNTSSTVRLKSNDTLSSSIEVTLPTTGGTLALTSDLVSSTSTYSDYLAAGSSFPYPGITSSFVRVNSSAPDQRVTLPTTTVLGTEVRVGNISTNTIIVNAGFGYSMYLKGIGSDLGFNTEIGIPPGQEYVFVYITDGVWSAYKTDSSIKSDYYFVQAGTTASHLTLNYDINTVISFSSLSYVYLPSNPYNGQEVIVVANLSPGNTFTVLSPINDGFIENGNGASQGINIPNTRQESKFVYTESTYNGTPYWHYYPIERATIVSSINTAIGNGTISNVTKKWKTTITTEQVLQLFTTPVEVLPTQSGYARIPTNIYIKRNAGTASYTLANNAFKLLNGTTDTNTNINPNPLTSTSVGYTSNTVYLSESVSGSDNGGPYNLKATTGNPTLGSGSLDVYVTYEEFPLF